MSSPCPACISENKSVATTTYYGIGGTARWFAQPRSLAELALSLAWARQRNLPIAIIGCGSNSLLADGTFNGLLLTLNELATCYWETAETLYVEAGVSNTEIAEVCLDAGRAGAAWMYRMPGHLGATVRMNARCYGGEISQIASEIFTLDVFGQLHIYQGSDVFHGYKKTLLMDTPEVVVAARLSLPTTAPREELLAFMESCESDRHRKHHFDHPSCGSTFKNNYSVGRPSGQVFDECGLKGTRRGDSQVSQHHANFVWNLGHASAHDMLSLAAHMRAQALSIKNADLELEVQPIGLFNADLYSGCALNRLGPSVEENHAYWVGLLWHPHAQTPIRRWQHESAKAALAQSGKAIPENQPTVLFESPFLGYFRTPGAGEPRLQVRLVQTLALPDATKNPKQPFLRWETRRTDASCKAAWEEFFPLRPNTAGRGQQAPHFLDQLWLHSVSELFIASGNPDSGEYFEFEFTPEGHWIAIAFDGPRRRKPAHTVPSASLWPELPFFKDDTQFGTTFSYELLAPLIHKNEILIQACLSLGSEGWFLAPHWSPSGSAECWDTQHKPDVKPDFHQPQRFWRVALV